MKAPPYWNGFRGGLAPVLSSTKVTAGAFKSNARAPDPSHRTHRTGPMAPDPMAPDPWHRARVRPRLVAQIPSASIATATPARPESWEAMTLAAGLFTLDNRIRRPLASYRQNALPMDATTIIADKSPVTKALRLLACVTG